jgi:hypothetical protein
MGALDMARSASTAEGIDGRFRSGPLSMPPAMRASLSTFWPAEV